jgi:protein-disulfide isomerase
MGNPNARVKLIEYGSLTCPHCAHFSVEGKPKLMPYVKSGRVSYEFRNYILNGIDVAASLLARCSGPANFFRFSDSLYATQPQWIGRITGLGQAQKDELKALPEGQRMVRMGELAGLTAMAGRHGVAPQRAKQCLANPAGLDRLGQIAEEAGKLGVGGTPTFLVGSETIVTQEWSDLEPLIRKAGG